MKSLIPACIHKIHKLITEFIKVFTRPQTRNLQGTVYSLLRCWLEIACSCMTACYISHYILQFSGVLQHWPGPGVLQCCTLSAVSRFPEICRYQACLPTQNCRGF